MSMGKCARAALLYTSALVGALYLGLVTGTAFAQSASYSFDIPAESLASALHDFARTSGEQIIFTDNLVAGKTVSPLRGKFTADEALERLLAGTDLVVDRSSPNGIMIQQKKERARSSEGAMLGNPTDKSMPAETVIVTAEKREENITNVPVPVSVLRPDVLTDNNLVLLRDYYSMVPGLSESPNIGANSTLAIRGITTGGFGTPTVGVTIDDVPFGGSTLYASGAQVPDIDPDDLAQVEVLRGPQGTLYGANSMGGLIKYVTIDPSTDAYSGKVVVGVSGVSNGDEPGYDVRAAFNVPLTDDLAMRASGYVRQDPGYINDPTYELTDVNRAVAEGGRLSVLWQPSNSVSLKLNALIQEIDEHARSETDTAPGSSQALEQDFLPGSDRTDRTIESFSAVLKADLDMAELTSITAYNINHYMDAFDFSPVFGSLVQSTFGVSGAPLYYPTSVDTFSQEIRFTGTIFDHLDWLVGSFYSHQLTSGSYNVLAENPTTLQVVGLFDHFASRDLFEEAAIFADLTFHFSDRFDVQLGARESFDSEILFSAYSGPYATIYLGGSPDVIPEEKSNGNAFTYLATPRFQISPDLMVYARFASGYRPGTLNAAAIGAPPASNPDTTNNYEIGLKGSFLDGLLYADTSLYYINWNDIQINLYTPIGHNAYTANGSGAKSEGVELSLQSHPVTGLSLTAWVDYDNAVLTAAFPTNSSAFGLPGNPLPNTPQFSANFAVEQDFPLGNAATGYVGGQATYLGDRLSVFTSSAQRQDFPSFTKLDFRLGLRADEWVANIFVNNATDTRGLLQGGLGYFYPNSYIYVTPRTIGINVSRNF